MSDKTKTIERDAVILGLERTRNALCLCHSRSPCACKFGARQICDVFQDGETGCPEVTVALELIMSLTDAEWRVLMGRVRAS